MNYRQQVENILKDHDLLDGFPSNYLERLHNAYEKAFEYFEGNLLSITLGGSGGKSCIHTGWSDLDIFLILNDYDIKNISLYNEAINENSKIHVGTTFYTLKEVEKEMINSKTKIMIYEKNNYFVNPTIYGKDFFIPVNYESVRLSDVNNLPNILHDYKRMVIDLKSGKSKPSRQHLKKLLILLKCILNYHNIFSFGYEEVILKFTRLCSELNFPLSKKGGIDIITLLEDYSNLKNYEQEIIDFSEEVFEFLYKFC